MIMADLKTNYVDDVLDTTKNQLRKYQQIQNDDGTVSFVDVTEYTQVGTSFGAKDINDTNAAINDVNGKLAMLDGSSKLGVANGILTYSQLRKYGKIVNISFRLTGCSIQYGAVIGTLPEGYRPSTVISILGVVFDGSNFHVGTISLLPNGSIFQEIVRATISLCIFSGSFIID